LAKNGEKQKLMRFKMYSIFLFILLLQARATEAQESYFPPVLGDEWETLSPDSLGWCEENINELYDFLEDENSKAFIVLKGGKIVLEKYYGTFTQDSLWYWASAGKTITAFMTGMAQEEGLLDIDAASSDYLSEGWTSCSPEDEIQISVRNQLSMTTGLNDVDVDVDCTDPECLTCLAPPNERWAYHNAPYTLLDQVIEGATGMNLNFYTYTRLGIPIGLQGAFVSLEFNNVFFSTPRDMARFGVLMSNGGTWDGLTIMSDMEYFNAMITPSQNLNPSYGYLWWLNGQDSHMLPGLQFQIPGPISPNAPEDVYAALGKNGQILSISPSQDLILVRMGNSNEDSFVSTNLHDDIWQRVMALECDTKVTEPTLKEVRAFPNPSNGHIQLHPSPLPQQELVLLDAVGRKCWQGYYGESGLDFRHLPRGSYYLVFSNSKYKTKVLRLQIQR
jgi:CubicO group peptidase (beta-lactamase class C family)